MVGVVGLAPTVSCGGRVYSPMGFLIFLHTLKWRTAMDLHHTRYKRAKHLAGVALPCKVYHPKSAFLCWFVSSVATTNNHNLSHYESQQVECRNLRLLQFGGE